MTAAKITLSMYPLMLRRRKPKNFLPVLAGSRCLTVCSGSLQPHQEGAIFLDIVQQRFGLIPVHGGHPGRRGLLICLPRPALASRFEIAGQVLLLRRLGWLIGSGLVIPIIFSRFIFFFVCPGSVALLLPVGSRFVFARLVVRLLALPLLFFVAL